MEFHSKLYKRMKKKTIQLVEVEKGVLFCTDILDAYKNAKYIELKRKSVDEDTKMETQILLVSNEAKEPIFILKTFSFNLADTQGLEQAKTEFLLAFNLGKESNNIAKGIAIREYKDVGSDTNNLEMLFEYGGSDLLDLIKKGLTDYQILDICIQTANAIALAHSKGIFHSDIKAQNIVYNNGIAKIIDFGVSSDLKSKTVLQRYVTSITGKIVGFTQCYCPPEMLDRLINNGERNYVIEKIDVYCWGMTIYQLMSKKTLEQLGNEWADYRLNLENYEKFKSEVKKLRFTDPIWDKFTKKIVICLLSCLNYSPCDRPQFKEIIDDYLCEISEAMQKKINDNTVVEVKKEKENTSCIYLEMLKCSYCYATTNC